MGWLKSVFWKIFGGDAVTTDSTYTDCIGEIEQTHQFLLNDAERLAVFNGKAGGGACNDICVEILFQRKLSVVVRYLTLAGFSVEEAREYVVSIGKDKLKSDAVKNLVSEIVKKKESKSDLVKKISISRPIE